jgi:hypothetical protein
MNERRDKLRRAVYEYIPPRYRNPCDGDQFTFGANDEHGVFWIGRMGIYDYLDNEGADVYLYRYGESHGAIKYGILRADDEEDAHKKVQMLELLTLELYGGVGYYPNAQIIGRVIPVEGKNEN